MSLPAPNAPFDRAALVAGALTLGLALSERQTEKLIRFCELLEHTNRSMNLTRIPPDQYVSLHLLDSLSLVSAINPNAYQSMLDAGTGAGFPGIPLAVVFPEINVTLVDSTRKKLVFLEQSCAELGIKNVRTVHSRLEALGREKRFRDGVPLVTARAVAPLGALAELILPLVAIGGTAVAYKGPGVEQEIEESRNSVQELGALIDRVQPISVPGTDAARFLVVMEKRAATPQRFPRPDPRRSGN